MHAYEVVPVGRVEGGRTEPIDDDWGAVESVIALDRVCFGPEVLSGLDEFSHLVVVFLFDRVDQSKINLGARRPRNREDWPMVGIFAQRAKGRPNRIGVSTCEIISVDGLNVHVRGLDAIDGTPVLDIKPYVREFEPNGDTSQPDWITELMADYWDSGNSSPS